MNIIDFIAGMAPLLAAFNRVRIPVTANDVGRFCFRPERRYPRKVKTGKKRKVLYSRRLTRSLENYAKD